MADQGIGMHRLLQLDGRCPGDGGAGGDVSRHAGARSHLGFLADAEMIQNARGGAEHGPIADPHAARDPRLGDDADVVADLNVVGDLHQIVDLRSVADAGRRHRRSIDRRVGADLDVVADDHVAHLRNLVQLAARFRNESETVAADDDAAVNPSPLADDRSGVNGNVGE